MSGLLIIFICVSFLMFCYRVQSEDNATSSSSSSSSSSESDSVKQARDLAAELGLEHHVIFRTYSSEVSIRQFVREVRKDNYVAVLDECKKRNIETLLLGHNMEDLLGKLGQKDMVGTEG